MEYRAIHRFADMSARKIRPFAALVRHRPVDEALELLQFLPNKSARLLEAVIKSAVGNAEHMNISLGKAGRKRWKGRKPHNRGTSMNPVNHPMGGGEGRTAGGRHPCSPTGVLAKGGKTRKKRKPSNAAIIRRRRPGPHYAGS